MMMMVTISGGFRGGPSQLDPPALGDGVTPSLMVLLICDNCTAYGVMATPSPVYHFKRSDHVVICTLVTLANAKF